MRHFKSNDEFGHAGVRANFLSIHMTVESLLGFGTMQQRPSSVLFWLPKTGVYFSYSLIHTPSLVEHTDVSPLEFWSGKPA